MTTAVTYTTLASSIRKMQQLLSKLLVPKFRPLVLDVKTMYQGDIIVGRLAMGAGTSNPAAAIELQAAA